jgi:hypothetical protein
MEQEEIMKKLWLFIAIALVAIIVYVVIYWWRFTSAWQPVTNHVEIYIPDLNESIYVSKKVWGVSYDHQIVLISSQPKEKVNYDSETDYIYQGLSSLFYKVAGRDLVIYTRKKSPIPKRFNSRANIVQVELDNQDMSTLRADYEKEGLKKIE